MSQSPPDGLFLEFQQAVAGRYSIDRELGRGGMGVVYLAREVHLDRLVAIKLLPPERAAQRTLRDRFLREARLAAKLSHPNIIPIFAVEETGGFVFYSMAFVDGETLAERVRTRGPMPATDGARMLREVAWALAYAHEQGLIHRDVKPDNILLESASGRVLVADFGIAAAAGDAADGVSGTPEFMSPEQALGTQLDARSDIYGLGATAFYAFSGRFPFEGKTATEVLAKQVTSPAPPLASLGLTVPRKVATLVDRCLSKSPDDRPESATALAEQLGVALEKRRELPATLRVFVKRTSRLDGPGTLLGAGLVVVTAMVSMLFMINLGATFGTIGGVILSIVLAVSASWAALADAASDLLRQGFSHRDVGPAFDVVLEQEREEHAIENSTQRVRLERVLRGVFFAGAGLLGSYLAISYFLSPNVLSGVANFLGVLGSRIYFALAVAGAVGAFFSGLGLLVVRNRPVEPAGSSWAKLWKGRAGRAAFWLASKLVKPTNVSALTHRATELSLGLAAEQLFESLPKATRKQLGDVPAVLKRLQADAQELRRRHETLVDAIAASPEGATGVDYTDVREMRDTLHGKLGDAVGALEMIRLNLLRLHAGSLDVRSVTTHLGLAADVSEEVERLIAAQGEVDKYLSFPRTPQASPV